MYDFIWELMNSRSLGARFAFSQMPLSFAPLPEVKAVMSSG